MRSGGGGGGGGGDDISARQLAKLNEEFSELKQSERISPTSGAHVISMAVIEAELTQQGISQHRKQELEIALVTITTNHANGFLTPVAYMQNLENRIGRDRYIMQYLMKCPQPRKVEAQVMMRRVKTMRQELVDMRAQIASVKS